MLGVGSGEEFRQRCGASLKSEAVGIAANFYAQSVFFAGRSNGVEQAIFRVRNDLLSPISLLPVPRPRRTAAPPSRAVALAALCLLA